MPLTKQFANERKLAKQLLAEDGFYQLKDKTRTTDQVHTLARTVDELLLHLDQEETRANAERHRADELEEKLALAQSRGFAGPDSYYGNVQARLADLEKSESLLLHQREDERERLQAMIDQRQSEWERAEAFGAALREIIADERTTEEIHGIANEALNSYTAPA